MSVTKINVLDKGYVRYDKHMGDDLDVINSAKVSFDRRSETFEDREARLLAFLVRDEHTSTFRHSTITLEVYAPLLTARQWFKYAVASSHLEDQFGWNESSRRYITEEPEFYVPTEWRVMPEHKKQGSGAAIEYLPADMDDDGENWIAYGEFDIRKHNNSFWQSSDQFQSLRNGGWSKFLDDSQCQAIIEKGPLPKDYHEYGYYWTQNLMQQIYTGSHWYELSQKWNLAPEQSRLFLPAYGMYVRWRWTFSLGAGLHFLHQRLAHDSQWEIQQYAVAVKDILQPLFPNAVAATLENI